MIHRTLVDRETKQLHDDVKRRMDKLESDRWARVEALEYEFTRMRQDFQRLTYAPPPDTKRRHAVRGN